MALTEPHTGILNKLCGNGTHWATHRHTEQTLRKWHSLSHTPACWAEISGSTVSARHQHAELNSENNFSPSQQHCKPNSLERNSQPDWQRGIALSTQWLLWQSAMWSQSSETAPTHLKDLPADLREFCLPCKAISSANTEKRFLCYWLDNQRHCYLLLQLCTVTGPTCWQGRSQCTVTTVYSDRTHMLTGKEPVYWCPMHMPVLAELSSANGWLVSPVKGDNDSYHYCNIFQSAVNTKQGEEF